jgi:uncharacterized RDD family membrane protein YckC
MTSSWQPPDDDGTSIPAAPPLSDDELLPGAGRAWLASYGARAGGWLLDMVICVVASAVIVNALGLVHKQTVLSRSSNGSLHTVTSYHTSALGLLIVAVILVAYGGGQIGVWGQTVGMRVTKIKAVAAVDGQPASLARSIGRAAIEIVFYAVLLLPWVLDMLWPIWDKQNQTLHDKIAGTVVVNTAAVTPPTISFG